jgi:hypothetical protein
MFFSEEKNQKTLVSALVERYALWRETRRCLGNEGLLLDFFRKIGSFPPHMGREK